MTNAHLHDLVLAQRCADHMERHEAEIVRVLNQHESYETAVDELHSSINTLRNLHLELTHLRKCHVDSVAVFVPINLPLYSLILFAAVPSLMASRVDVRLPAATPQWLRDVAAAAGLDQFFPRMHLLEATRRQFIDGIASKAQAVIFTGRHDSAEQVRSQCPNSLFIYQGSGVNPVVIGPTAELTDEAIDNIVTARVFNSGQDCAAPDVFLVHTKRLDDFVGGIVDRINALPTGSYDDPQVRIGAILNPQPLKELAQRLATLKEDTVCGGEVDLEAAFVAPTVVVRPLADHDTVEEFFAPVFYVLVYENDDELAAFFAHRDYTDNAMYVSLYGQDVLPGLFESSTVLFNRTVLEVEQGNTAFGGNGAKSNYVALGSEVTVGPVLISEALARAAAPSRRHLSPVAARPRTDRPAHIIRDDSMEIRPHPVYAAR
jgi:acyl-CoA reductase-like NAD-dependent aldehyde dehydrogenase